MVEWTIVTLSPTFSPKLVHLLNSPRTMLLLLSLCSLQLRLFFIRPGNNTMIRRPMQIHRLGIKEIHKHGKDERKHIPNGGYNHTKMRTPRRHERPSRRRKHGASRNGRHEERTSDLGMTTETRKGSGEDCGETCGLKGENHHQERNRCGAGGVHGSDAEDEREEEVEEEDEAGLDTWGHHGEGG